jgi:hypothetical protein
MSHVARNLPWAAWGGLIGWLLAKAHRGWVVNLQRRSIQRLLAENTRLLRRQGAPQPGRRDRRRARTTQAKVRRAAGMMVTPSRS